MTNMPAAKVFRANLRQLRVTRDRSIADARLMRNANNPALYGESIAAAVATARLNTRAIIAVERMARQTGIKL